MITQKFQKRLFPTLIILFMLVSACKKTEQSTKVEDLLKGSWELRFSEGGIAGASYLMKGNGILLILSDTSYERYSDRKLDEKGTYKLIKEISTTGEFDHSLIYNDDIYSMMKIEKITKNELTLFQESIGLTIIYAKK